MSSYVGVDPAVTNSLFNLLGSSDTKEHVALTVIKWGAWLCPEDLVDFLQTVVGLKDGELLRMLADEIGVANAARAIAHKAIYMQDDSWHQEESMASFDLYREVVQQVFELFPKEYALRWLIGDGYGFLIGLRLAVRFGVMQPYEVIGALRATTNRLLLVRAAHVLSWQDPNTTVKLLMEGLDIVLSEAEDLLGQYKRISEDLRTAVLAARQRIDIPQSAPVG